MGKSCKCSCDKEECKGKKTFFWLIPIGLLLVTGFGLFGPKKIRKSAFGKVFKLVLGVIWGGVVIFSVITAKKVLKAVAEK